MIVFETVTLKNFLSYGNTPTVFKLTEHQLTCIRGKNGSGKCLRGSTEIDIKFKNKEVEQQFIKFLENNK